MGGGDGVSLAEAPRALCISTVSDRMRKKRSFDRAIQ